MRFLAILLLPAVVFSQVVLEPSDQEIYNYLSRLSQKGIISFKDHARPIPRIYIARKISEAFKHKSKLTPLENDELEFYISEYALEISRLKGNSSLLSQSSTASLEINGLPAEESFPTVISNYIISSKRRINIASSISGRWRAFNYNDSLFVFNLDPVLGYGSGKYDDQDLDHFWFGAGAWGYLKDYIGYSARFENHYLGGKTFRNKISPDPGVTEVKNKSRIEFYQMHFNLNYSWDWGSITLAKENMQWGYGKGGNLVLSRNAPSFPFLQLSISPVEWLDFSWFHGWLASDVIDSSQAYPTTIAYRNRNVYRNKYFASNTITFHPFSKLSFSLGNSVIFSDRVEVLYLIPVMIYKVVDFEKYRGSNSLGDNIQLFAAVSSRNLIPNTHLYGTFFLDEFSVDIYEARRERNMFAFMLGASLTDLPINNITLTAEYTKIYPFVYSHYIPTQTYENSSFILGHWMGHNADQVFASINYRVVRGLQVELWGNLIRKGESGTVKMQYNYIQPPFLFGLRRYYSIAGMEVKYELIHNLHLNGRYIFNELSAETDSGDRDISHRNEIYFSLSYGLF